MKKYQSNRMAIVAVVFIMICVFLVNKQKARAREAARLPYYGIELSQVPDGTYRGKTYTSFLHLQLDVTVENHTLKAINIVENDGIDGATAAPIVEEMIRLNKVVVPAVSKAKLGSLCYISCVDSALKSAIGEELKSNDSKD